MSLSQQRFYNDQSAINSMNISGNDFRKSAQSFNSTQNQDQPEYAEKCLTEFMYKYYIK